MGRGGGRNKTFLDYFSARQGLRKRGNTVERQKIRDKKRRRQKC